MWFAPITVFDEGLSIKEGIRKKLNLLLKEGTQSFIDFFTFECVSLDLLFADSIVDFSELFLRKLRIPRPNQTRYKCFPLHVILLADSLVVVDSVHEKDVVNEDFSILFFEVFWTFGAVGDAERRDYAFDLLRFRGHSELVEKVAYIDVDSLPAKIKLIDVRLYYFRVGVLVAQKLTNREF